MSIFDYFLDSINGNPCSYVNEASTVDFIDGSPCSCIDKAGLWIWASHGLVNFDYSSGHNPLNLQCSLIQLDLKLVPCWLAHQWTHLLLDLYFGLSLFVDLINCCLLLKLAQCFLDD